MMDNVNHPPHYSSKAKCSKCSHPIECIDVTQHLDFNIGNAIKYLWRYKDKNGIEDLKKAIWYIDNQIKNLEESKSSDVIKTNYELPWISISKRNPIKGQLVIISDINGNSTVPVYYIEGVTFLSPLEGSNIRYSDIWCEMPKPPKHEYVASENKSGIQK